MMPPMAMELKVDTDAEEVGFDAGRLERIDRHFARYVDEGQLPGWLIVVTRRGRVAHLSRYGHADVEAGRPVEVDTLWRIFSMTKPVTSVAAMMLFEEGAFDLKDPIARWLPEFDRPQVYVKGSALNPLTEPAIEPIRLWHLFTHTAGLTYGFHHAHPVDAMYRSAGFEWGTPPDLDLEACCDKWAQLPLLFHPGTEWNYLVATDVLGRVVEVLSGQSLDAFFAERIDAMGKAALSRPKTFSGGGGLVSTAHDYHRFAQMLLRGGELDGTRLLSPRTVAMMASNHLPGGVDLEAIGRPLFAETTFDGVGFGLGVSVTIDPVKAKVPGHPGEYGWGGAASTAFWVDPVEDIDRKSVV